MTEAGNKRSRDDAEGTSVQAEEGDASKKQKQEAEAAGEQADEAQRLTEHDEQQQPEQVEDIDAGDAAAGASTEGAAEEAGPLQGGGAEVEADKEDDKGKDEPHKIGYRTFPNGNAAHKYYRMLLKELTPNQDLNEYEHHMVLELLKHGHPEADRKMGDSLRAIQVRSHAQEPSVCFHLMRSDGTVEDFSTNKCIATLFPAWSASHAAKAEAGSTPKRGGRGQGSGGHSGRGRGGGHWGGRGMRGRRGRGRRGRH